jgi:hypothetical protein
MRIYKQISLTLVVIGAFIPAVLFAATGTIDATSHRARLCDNIVGNTDCHSYTRVNWLLDPSGYSTPPVPVAITDTVITGLIWSEKIGWIKLNPDAPTPPDAREGVKNTTLGVLSGLGFAEAGGWVNFGPANGGVTIDAAGEFVGWAWLSGYGWMHFDCAIADACVKTDWRPTPVSSSGGSGGSGGGGGGHIISGGGGTIVTGGGGTNNGGTTNTTGAASGGSHVVPPWIGTTNTAAAIVPVTTPDVPAQPAVDICALGNPTSLFGFVVGQAVRSFCQTKVSVGTAAKSIKEVISSPAGTTATKTIVAAGIVTGTLSSIISALFLNPLSFSEIFLLPVRLWALFLAAVGIKKRRRPWGTVYDSVTKQPLDPVRVTLRDQEGIEIASRLTDLDGRYGFVVSDPGNYTLTAHRMNYVFPSQKLVGRDHDELYRDLYFGEHFVVTRPGEIIIKNIPMDPEHFDWTQFTKRHRHLMQFYSNRQKAFRIFSDTLFGLCFTVTTMAVLAAPKIYNIITFALYVILYFVRVNGRGSRPFGYVVEKETGYPISFGIIRISNMAGDDVMHRITDAEGRYYALLDNGEYHVRIDRKLPDGSYTTVVENALVTVKDGYLSEKFYVQTQGPDVPMKIVAPESLVRHYSAQIPPTDAK